MRIKTIYLLGCMSMLGVLSVGCVDVEEPVGIQDVRSAKVDFLKAQSALQLAEAKLTEAKAATEAASAKIKEAEAQSIALQNAADQAKSEQDKAKFELELKVLQAKTQVELQNIQTQVLDAQRVYQQALADLNYLKTVGIPNQYLDKLDNLKNELSIVSEDIVFTENVLIRTNISLSIYSSRDSLKYDYDIRDRYVVNSKMLKLNQDQLAVLQQIKNASSAESQKAVLAAKIASLNTDLATYTNRSLELKTQIADLGKDNEDLRFQRMDKAYGVSLAIPESIRSAVYNSYRYSYFFADDKSTMSKTEKLDNLITYLSWLKSFADNQKAANVGNSDWAEFADNIVSKEYNSLVKQRGDLDAKMANLANNSSNLSIQLNSVSQYIGVLNSSINAFSSLLSSLSNTTIDQQIKNVTDKIAEAQALVNQSKVELDAWKSGFRIDDNGDFVNEKRRIQQQVEYYQGVLKNLKERFDALTKQKDALVKLINDYNK